MKRDTWFHDDFETALGDGELIIPRTEICEVVDSILVCMHGCFNSSVHILGGDCRLDDDRCIGIKYTSRNACEHSLSGSRSTERERTYNCADEETRHRFLFHVWNHLAFEIARSPVPFLVG